MKLKREYLIDVALILALATFASHDLLFASGLAAGEDAPGVIYMWKISELSVWNPNEFFGFGTLVHAGPFWLLLKGLTYTLNLDPLRAYNAGIFAQFALAGLSMYLFSLHATGSRVAALTSAVVYMFGYYPIPIAHGQPEIGICVAFLPLVLYTFERGLRVINLRNMIISALVLTFFLSSQPDQVLIATFFFILYLAFYLLFKSPDADARNRSMKLLNFLLPTVFLTFLLSAYWVLPLPSSSLLYFEGWPPHEAYRWSLRNIIEALRFARPTVPEWVLPQLRRLFLFCIPLLAFSALLVKKDRPAITFASLGLFFMLLSMGPYAMPLDLFIWLWHHVPFYSNYRSGTRFLMVTELSFAFLAGVTLHAIHRVFSRFHVKYMGSQGSVSALSYLPVGLTFAVVLTQSLLWGIGGFGVYNWPESDMRPFEWVSEQPGRFRVLTLPYIGSYQRGIRDPRMLMGMVHEIGAVSYGIHGRPVADGVHMFHVHPDTHEYLEFTRTSLDGKTNRLAELFGVGAVKYVVVGHDATASLKMAAESQRDLRVVERIDGSEILVNQAIRPGIFAVERAALVFGDLDTIPSLLAVDGFSLGRWALVFAHQEHNRPLVEELAQRSDAIIFSSRDLLDFAFITSGKNFTINAADYTSPIKDPHKCWVITRWPPNDEDIEWIKIGKLVLGGRQVLMTYGNADVDIPMTTSAGGSYDLLLRIWYGPSPGALSIEVDGKSILQRYQPRSCVPFFDWIEFSDLQLQKGSHTLTVKNDGEGPASIDVVALVPSNTTRKLIDRALQITRESPARMVVVLEAEKDFLVNHDGAVSWRAEKMPFNASNGYILISELGLPSGALTSMFIPRDGDYVIAARTIDRPDGGRLDVELDGAKVGEIPTVGLTTELGWHEIGPVRLDASRHIICIRSDGTGSVGLDELILYSVDGKTTSIDEFFSTPQPAEVRSERPNPSRFLVNVTARDPFWLVMGESYHPQWKAYADGEEIAADRHVMVDGYANAWYIDKVGSYTLVLEYWPQKLFEVGIVISTVSGIICLLIIWRCTPTGKDPARVRSSDSKGVDDCSREKRSARTADETNQKSLECRVIGKPFSR